MESKDYQKMTAALINTGNHISQKVCKKNWESDTPISLSMLERNSLKF